MISMAYLPKALDHQQADIDIHNQAEAPIRYASLERVYSASTTGCVSGSHSVMSKKVKAQRLTSTDLEDMDVPGCQRKPDIMRVYSRRCGSKRPRQSFFDSVVARREGLESKKEVIPKNESVEIEGFSHEDGGSPLRKQKKRRVGSRELVKLGVDSSRFGRFDGSRLRDSRNYACHVDKEVVQSRHKKQISSQKGDKAFITSASAKKWVRLSYEGIDPKVFIGLQCKVFWPLDADWYAGRIVGYNSETKRHHVEYTDGDEEDLNFLREKIKFHISREEMQHLNLSFSSNIADADLRDYDEMVVLAASLDECLDFEPGDIIWAKLTGHAMWPAIVVDESLIGDRKGLNKVSGERAVLVQFFGTHDFARLKVKQVISFLKGLLSAFHLKCKQPRFERSMEEAKMYLSEHKLPPKMLQLRNGDAGKSESTTSGEESGSDSGLDRIKNGEVRLGPGGFGTYQHIVGDLRILNLGKVVTDSKFFQSDKFVWPEGYTAVRDFTSIKDPTVSGSYKMEVLRDAESKTRPLFRVTADNGEQFKGSTPSACWNKVYAKIGKLQSNNTNSLSAEREEIHGSGTEMFGFSNPKVSKLIQGILNTKTSSKFSMSKCGSGRCQDPPAGYRPVRVDWKDLDKCNVCHMDEEYENNLFLQCDKCRMMVHARCYGELEPCDGVLWLCNLCRRGAPDTPPRCCLCPVVGGAMKPTTDGRWAHLACAIWIPETCLSDVKRMEPIDGVNRVSKDRWKLLCSICGVSYGACIQCSNNICRVAYHPLCARAAGLCLELEDEDRLHVLSLEDDEADQCIRLLSFCKRHRQPPNSCPGPDDRIGPSSHKYSDYRPPLNPSGCARTEPYNCSGRRGLKEPEALAAASSKRLYVANQPYVVGGYLQHELADYRLIHGSKVSQLGAPSNALSMCEKYTYMKDTYRKRLAFGKSGIHGFGIFAKLPHRAGDMVIEYSGELVRPPIADRREHLIYNSLVGAGTYMFRIDDERVIDATRAGSIAHLINHSCEPNCYSRVISVNGDEHIIIFAKRDIKRWEELTYDYRFFSIDERLACYCGFPRCRGIVNDAEAEEQASKLYAPRCDLIDLTEE